MDTAATNLELARERRINGEEATGEVLIAYQRGTETESRRRVVPIWLFESDKLKLRCDRAVSVAFEYCDDDSVLAACERLHLFASGASPAECIRDIQHQVSHFFTFYSNCTQDEVTGIAAELRKLYVKHFSVLSESDR